MPTHNASLGRLDGFNLPSNNVNTMSLAWTYWGIPRDWGAIPPSPVGPEMSQYKPPAFGRRFVLTFQGLRVLDGIAPPISWYSPIRPRQTHGILSLLSKNKTTKIGHFQFYKSILEVKTNLIFLKMIFADEYKIRTTTFSKIIFDLAQS